jgi:hypothetical protein
LPVGSPPWVAAPQRGGAQRTAHPGHSALCSSSDAPCGAHRRVSGVVSPSNLSFAVAWTDAHTTRRDFPFQTIASWATPQRGVRSAIPYLVCAAACGDTLTPLHVSLGPNTRMWCSSSAPRTNSERLSCTETRLSWSVSSKVRADACRTRRRSCLLPERFSLPLCHHSHKLDCSSARRHANAGHERGQGP